MAAFSASDFPCIDNRMKSFKTPAKCREFSLFHSAFSRLSFTSTTLKRQCCFGSSETKFPKPLTSENNSRIQRLRCNVEFFEHAKKASPSPFHPVYLFPTQTWRRRLRGRPTADVFFRRTSRGLRLRLALNCEVWKRIQTELFSSDYSHIPINMIFKRKGSKVQFNHHSSDQVPPFLFFTAFVCNKWLFLPAPIERCFRLLFKRVWFISASSTTLV